MNQHWKVLWWLSTSNATPGNWDTQFKKLMVMMLKKHKGKTSSMVLPAVLLVLPSIQQVVLPVLHRQLCFAASTPSP